MKTFRVLVEMTVEVKAENEKQAKMFVQYVVNNAVNDFSRHIIEGCTVNNVQALNRG